MGASGGMGDIGDVVTDPYEAWTLGVEAGKKSCESNGKIVPPRFGSPEYDAGGGGGSGSGGGGGGFFGIWKIFRYAMLAQSVYRMGGGGQGGGWSPQLFMMQAQANPMQLAMLAMFIFM